MTGGDGCTEDVDCDDNSPVNHLDIGCYDYDGNDSRDDGAYYLGFVNGILDHNCDGVVETSLGLAHRFGVSTNGECVQFSRVYDGAGQVMESCSGDSVGTGHYYKAFGNREVWLLCCNDAECDDDDGGGAQFVFGDSLISTR